jgi:hypothetical protein
MKKTLSILILILFFFIFGSYLISSDTDFSKNVKKLFPNNLKTILKETVFIIPNLKKENQKLKSKLDIVENNLKYLMIGNLNMVGRKIIINPYTDLIDTNKFTIAKFFLPGMPHNTFGYQVTDFYKGRYVDIYKDNLLIIDSFKFYTTSSNNNFFKLEKINLREVKSNIKDFTNLVGIRDIKIIKNSLFISGVTKNLETESCYGVQILKAKLNNNPTNEDIDAIVFNNFLNFDFCAKNGVQSGGRIDQFNEDSIIISFGDFGKPEWDGKENDFFSDNNYLGKIISINLKNKKIKILSKGHRNPQGLLYFKDKNIIINTEHGPSGGDEININFLDKIYNFGWPLASYGKRYNGDNPFLKNHEKFDEPIKYYNPSIAPSQITYKKENIFYISSLKALSLFKIKFSEDYKKVLNQEKIIIGERIRDIVYINNKIYCLILENTPAIAFLKFKN